MEILDGYSAAFHESSNRPHLLLGCEPAALGLVFDPRYRDLPFAPLCAAVAPFLVLRFSGSRPAGASAKSRAVAERIAAGVLALSAIYILLNESFANWQADLFCAGLIALALILARAPGEPD